jgi:5-methyltetrahydropteroyltriglutamate--homocysteine methyltransferase
LLTGEPPYAAAAAAGRITAADLRAVEDEESIKAVRMQEEVGLQSATDGEFQRATWHMDFIYALGGVSRAPGHLAVKFTNPSGTIEWTPAALHVGSRVRLEHTIFGEDVTFLKDHVTTAVPSGRGWSPPMTSSAASMRRPSTSRWIRSACPASAGSPPRWRATR